jgi:hypothetical protein
MVFSCNNAAMRNSTLALALTFLFIALPLRADDGAASIGAGGIILMKREPRIAMAKEVLTISATRVTVDYDFRNDSADNITTEVAFPIPAYEFSPDGASASAQGFDDFQLWVAGKPVAFATETRAFVGQRDVTSLLTGLHVDIASFGHFNYDSATDADTNFHDVARLDDAQRAQLVQAGAIGTDGGIYPKWTVQKKYHWTQAFPAHAVVHIRHQYTPVVGGSNTIGDMNHYNAKGEEFAELNSLCPTPGLLNTLTQDQARAEKNQHLIGLDYVDFILTTANTWKTPIEDFTLLITRPSEPGDDVNYVSLCWDGPIQKVDADHFSAHVSGLVPSKELRVGYIVGSTK